MRTSVGARMTLSSSTTLRLSSWTLFGSIHLLSPSGGRRPIPSLGTPPKFHSSRPTSPTPYGTEQVLQDQDTIILRKPDGQNPDLGLAASLFAADRTHPSANKATAFCTTCSVAEVRAEDRCHGHFARPFKLKELHGQLPLRGLRAGGRCRGLCCSSPLPGSAPHGKNKTNHKVYMAHVRNGTQAKRRT